MWEKVWEKYRPQGRKNGSGASRLRRLHRSGFLLIAQLGKDGRADKTCQCAVPCGKRQRRHNGGGWIEGKRCQKSGDRCGSAGGVVDDARRNSHDAGKTSAEEVAAENRQRILHHDIGLSERLQHDAEYAAVIPEVQAPEDDAVRKCSAETGR